MRLLMSIHLRTAFFLIAGSFLSACAELQLFTPEAATVIKPTQQTRALENLAPPASPIFVAVYEFPDLTGQNKPNTKFAEYSRAVTQGADAILVDVLEEVGQGKWFSLVERRGVNNVLRERQLITATRQQFLGPDAPPLDALNFAGLLFEGGVIAYESNISNGGVGAKYLGIGASTKYSKDIVTVNLRAVSVQSGAILASTTTTKTIYSTVVQGDVFKYVGLNQLLELEAGTAANEPAQFALREAIEAAVYSLIIEGAKKGVWSFKDPAKQKSLITNYKSKKAIVAG
jgi:curli production assembly/transport component CsgG